MNLIEALGDKCQYKVYLDSFDKDDYICTDGKYFLWKCGAQAVITPGKLASNDWKRRYDMPELPAGYRLLKVGEQLPKKYMRCAHDKSEWYTWEDGSGTISADWTYWFCAPIEPQLPEQYEFISNDVPLPHGWMVWYSINSPRWLTGSIKSLGQPYGKGAEFLCAPIKGTWAWAKAQPRGTKVRCACWMSHKYIYQSTTKHEWVGYNDGGIWYPQPCHETARNWQLYIAPKPTQSEVDAAKDALLNQIMEWYSTRKNRGAKLIELCDKYESLRNQARE